MTQPHLTRAVPLNRRLFLAGAAATASAFSLGGLVFAEARAAKPNKICAFIKFLQSLSYEELADTIAELGFDGIEATVRKGGYIPPDRAEDELPKLVEALAKRDLEITVMATDVARVDQPYTESVLRTAASVGIPCYRMGFYRYDMDQPILDQLAETRLAVEDLAAFNRELGIQALYQNHSGAKYIGATLWDWRYVTRDIPSSAVAAAFDIRHATIEAGLSWPVVFRMMRPVIGAIYVKDFQWQGRKAKHVPLGTGRVDPKFFKMARDTHFDSFYSLHVEYLGKSGTAENIAALQRDVAVLRAWLK